MKSQEGKGDGGNPSLLSKYHLGLEDGPHRIPGTRSAKEYTKAGNCVELCMDYK